LANRRHQEPIKINSKAQKTGLTQTKPHESIRLSGDFEAVGHCVEHGLRTRDPNRRYEFVAGAVEGRIEGNGE